MLTSPWRKATKSSQSSGACVEVRLYETATMQVRDTKLQHSPILDVDAANWQSFLAEFTK